MFAWTLAASSAVLACSADDDDGAGGDGGQPVDQACLGEAAWLDGPRSYVYSVAWSPIDDLALAGTDGEIRLLRVDTEAETVEEVATVAERPMAAVVKWSADGRFAMTAGHELKLLAVSHDPPALTQLAFSDKNYGTIFGMDWTLDGKYVITGEEGGAVRVFAVDVEARTLTPEAEFYGGPGKVFGVDWSPDGRHAAVAGEDGSTRLLEVDFDADPMAIRELEAEFVDDVVNAVNWAESGDLLLSGTWWDRHVVQIWSVDAESGTLALEGEYAGHPTGIVLMEWSRDRRRLVTAGHDDVLHLSMFDGGSLTDMAVLEDHPSGVHSASWSRDERYLLMSSSMIDRISLVDMRDCPAE